MIFLSKSQLDYFNEFQDSDWAKWFYEGFLLILSNNDQDSYAFYPVKKFIFKNDINLFNIDFFEYLYNSLENENNRILFKDGLKASLSYFECDDKNIWPVNTILNIALRVNDKEIFIKILNLLSVGAFNRLDYVNREIIVETIISSLIKMSKPLDKVCHECTAELLRCSYINKRHLDKLFIIFVKTDPNNFYKLFFEYKHGFKYVLEEIIVDDEKIREYVESIIGLVPLSMVINQVFNINENINRLYRILFEIIFGSNRFDPIINYIKLDDNIEFIFKRIKYIYNINDNFNSTNDKQFLDIIKFIDYNNIQMMKKSVNKSLCNSIEMLLPS